MNRYHYDGPVKEFDVLINVRWVGDTYAVSESKARSNLIYQYKIQHSKAPSSKVTLPGKVLMFS